MIKRARVKTLKIDGIAVSGKSNQTIMEVARENGINIPALCYLEGLESIGACRLCLVEVVGQRNLVSACTFKIKEGMEVVTSNENLKKYRRQILSMMFAERNHTCSVCVSNGHCELQSMATELGMTHSDFPYTFPKVEVDASHKRFVSDPNRCILCKRCVRVCDEIEGAHTWDIWGRGIDSRVITDFGDAWGDSDTCTSCSKCVQVCPTGALSEKGVSVAEMAKKKEFLPYLQMNRGNK